MLCGRQLFPDITRRDRACDTLHAEYVAPPALTLSVHEFTRVVYKFGSAFYERASIPTAHVQAEAGRRLWRDQELKFMLYDIA